MAEAWVTLATNDSYALGALVVSRSLKRVNTKGSLVVMITPGVSGPMKTALSSEFNLVVEVNILDSKDAANLALLTRPELGITFTKLHCWKLVQFSKCVFLDADTLVLQNCDELFDRDEFSAAPDVGWPDCFNSGVFVFNPSIQTFNELLAHAVSRGSFDGGDQGLLNLYFNDWSISDIGKHLPFIYNMVASATYSYLPAFKLFGANVKIVHFIGPEKPWLMYFDSSTGSVRAPAGQEHLHELLQSWWDIFRTDVHNKLSPEMGVDEGHTLSATVAEQAGLAGAFAKMSLEGAKSEQQIEFEEQMRKHAWESGHIDYLGKDSFDNIMKKIHASMAQTTQAPPPSKEPTPPPAAPTKESTPPPAVPAKAPTPPPITEPTPPPTTEPIPPPAPPTTEPTPPPAVPTVEPTPAPPTTEPIPQQPADQPSAPPPPSPTAAAPQQPVEPAALTTEQEDALRAEERLALEKKLGEQKRVAEQKLIEEKQAAEARALAAAAAQEAISTTSVPSTEPETKATAASDPTTAPSSADPPTAPPRRHSKGK